MKRENPSPGDVAIFAQLVIGFLEKGNIRPKVVGLCRDLLVKFSTVKVCDYPPDISLTTEKQLSLSAIIGVHVI